MLFARAAFAPHFAHPGSRRETTRRMNPCGPHERNGCVAGSAPRSGRGGRRFKSYHSDQYLAGVPTSSANGSAKSSRHEWGTQSDFGVNGSVEQHLTAVPPVMPQEQVGIAACPSVCAATRTRTHLGGQHRPDVIVEVKERRPLNLQMRPRARCTWMLTPSFQRLRTRHGTPRAAVVPKVTADAGRSSSRLRARQ